MDRAELDRQYSPSSLVPHFKTILDRYRSESAAARARLVCEPDVRYGPDPAEVLDLFPATRPDAPLHVFVHGGHWQQLSKDDSSFAAPAFVAAGAAVAPSPLHHLPLHTTDVIVARGADETAEYARQHTLFVSALGARGASTTDLVVAGRNHFDLPLDLGRPDTVLGRAVLDQMRLR